ncbi:MAG: HDOD domain-containing protein [Treponema sp.]|nr:HDOD domain-containing protein [Treponema sp.]
MAEKKVLVDSEKIKMAIRTGLPLTIITYTLPHDMEIYMGDILAAFLSELGQNHMVQYLTYCQQELITNAEKANTKRIYFREKKLDINNEADYNEGMKDFKRNTLNNIAYYLEKQKRAGLYVKLVIQYRNKKIKMEVHNNSTLNVFEYKRIHDKLSRVQQYTSVDDALNQILDETEGAGLGLIIMILMLEKIGMTEENFQIICENGETITRIILPVSSSTEKDLDIISSEFEKNIDDLPQFPENITRLNALLSDSEAKMSEIAVQISNDVALTGELLKQVNSAAFALSRPCKNIAEAVKMVGIRGIKNMLFTVGSLKSFAEVGGSNENLWKHAYQTAFFAHNLARNLCASDREIIEDSYICGLLHDMGKIVFESSHPEFLENIKSVCVKKGIDSELFEKILSGVNHGEIGARIAEKWNFPRTIVSVIRYHHAPELAPPDFRKLTAVIYIADLMIHYQDGDVEFYQIDSEILKMFNILSENQFQKISEKLKVAFSNRMN